MLSILWLSVWPCSHHLTCPGLANKCLLCHHAVFVCCAFGVHPCCTAEMPLVTNIIHKFCWDGRRVTSACVHTAPSQRQWGSAVPCPSLELLSCSLPVHFVPRVKQELLIALHTCWVFTGMGTVLGWAQLMASRAHFLWQDVRNALFQLTWVVTVSWLASLGLTGLHPARGCLIGVAWSCWNPLQECKGSTQLCFYHIRKHHPMLAKAFTGQQAGKTFTSSQAESHQSCAVLISKIVIKSSEQCQLVPDKVLVHVELVDMAQ